MQKTDTRTPDQVKADELRAWMYRNDLTEDAARLCAEDRSLLERNPPKPRSCGQAMTAATS